MQARAIRSTAGTIGPALTALRLTIGASASRPLSRACDVTLLMGNTMTLVDSTIASRDQILATIDEHADELRNLGAKSLALFGSMARGEGSDSSDIDMLVELQSKTFDAYMDVKFFLEKILGRKVDLVLADAVKPRLRSAILGEAVRASRL